MDDTVESTRKLEKLGDMPAVDMSMPSGVESVGDLEVDDDDEEEANMIDVASKEKAEKAKKASEAMEVDEEEVDPLDAFMSEVKKEVKKVNEADLQKVSNGKRPNRLLDDRIGDEGVEDPVQVPEDELDATELNPEDILALAAKKAKKKDLAIVDHSRVVYEPFRKEFYHPPPEVQDMTDEEADLLRLELDGIKIRGIDCPRPITKWSHCGLPSSWYVLFSNFSFTEHTLIILM
jgi:ATP-dependent RNA helicase DDX46/PRP5